MWGHGWGFMDEWDGYGWYGPFHMIIWIVALVVIVALVSWFFRSGSNAGGAAGPQGRRPAGLDVLEERYARGEINREEFLQKKRDIAG